MMETHQPKRRISSKTTFGGKLGRKVEKDAKYVEKQRSVDMRTIEELNFNKEPIP